MTATTFAVVTAVVAHRQPIPIGRNPFDYQWVADRWVSSSEYPFHCDDGGTVETTRSDFLVPIGDGSFHGERTFAVGAPGCPGDGPEMYWLPFTLTLTRAPSPPDSQAVQPTAASAAS